MKAGICVSIVSIVSGCDGGLPNRAGADQMGAMFIVAYVIGRKISKCGRANLLHSLPPDTEGGIIVSTVSIV
jgi:hypothetical protein